MLRALVRDSYAWYVGIVDERRPLTRAEVLAVADGSIFTGRQGLERKLVDALGGQDEAVEWLVGKGVDAGLEVVEWKPVRSDGLWGTLSLARLAGAALGLDRAGADLARQIGADSIFLDGLLSLWQPDPGAYRD